MDFGICWGLEPISHRYQEMTECLESQNPKWILAMWGLVPLTPALFKGQLYHELIIGEKITDYKEVCRHCEDTEIFLC